MDPSQLTVVYHAAVMQAADEVIPWQLRELARNGLTRVLCTHVGPRLQWLKDMAREAAVDLDVRFTDPNTDHYETPAMFLIEQLRECAGAVLYLHTKGVTQPGSYRHRRWRELMHTHVIDKHRKLLAMMPDKEICGLDWIEQGHGEGHFSGNFWLATWEYIRRLPDYGTFHVANGLTRFSAEQWLGRGKPPPRVHSEFVMNVPWYQLCTL